MRAAAGTEVLRAPVVHLTDPAPRSRQNPARSELIRRVRRLRVGRAVSAALVLLACGLAHVWVRLQVTELGYALNTAGEIVTRLEREQRELETELAMLTAPQHLADEARRRLDMREPEPGQVVVLR
jgi:cell division protein FtsL